MIVFSMDPGTTTGFVEWRGYAAGVVHAGNVHEGIVQVREIKNDGKYGWVTSAEEIVSSIRGASPWGEEDVDGKVVFLYENFILRGGRGHSSEASALDSVRVTSAVLALLGDCGWDGRVIGFDASIKATITDERMKRWGLWLTGRSFSCEAKKVIDRPEWKGFDGHATDAARGLVWFLRQVGVIGGWGANWRDEN